MGPQPDASDPAAMRRYTQTYEYDPADNLIKLVHTPVGGTGWTRRYNYTSTGNRLQSTSISGDSPGATYTTAGTYTYSDHYEYDEHGSMTSMPHLPTMAWGHRDELTECTVGSETLHFQYAGGQRVRKYVTKTGTTTEERVYIGRYEKYTRRISGAEDMVRETLHLGDDLGRVAMVETKTVDGGTAVGSPVGMWRHPLGNMLGTAGGETTEDGSVIGYEEYHPYGTTAYRAKASGIDVSERRYRYTGMEQDEETGLGYHTARYYAGWLGRWVSADPIGLGGGGNRFAYASNRPTTNHDANGAFDLPTWEDIKGAATDAVDSVRRGASAVANDPIGSAAAAATAYAGAVEWGFRAYGEALGERAGAIATEAENAFYDVTTHKDGVLAGAQKKGYEVASAAYEQVTGDVETAIGEGYVGTAQSLAEGDVGAAAESWLEGAAAAWRLAAVVVGGGAGLKSLVRGKGGLTRRLGARPTTAPANGAGLADDAARVVGKVDGAGVPTSDGIVASVPAANGTRYRIGEPVAPIEKSLDIALEPQLYIDAVVEKYRINLRGSGQKIRAVFNPDLVAAGRSRAATPNVIEIGPAALRSESELANTIAHELNHARSWLRGGMAPENTAYPAGNALSEFIAGLR
jgi:RHS repeat-associated protein